MRLPSDFNGIPAYGMLSLLDEQQWHKNYLWFWYQYTAPYMKNLLVGGTDTFINSNWSLMSAEYKAAVWALMNDEERQHIRNVRSNA